MASQSTMSSTHNIGRGTPMLPGTSMPAIRPVPTVHIRRASNTLPGRHGWVLDFDSPTRPRPDPLTGWWGGSDTLSQVQLIFPDLQSAIAYAEKQGWHYEIFEPAPHRVEPRSYLDRLKYDLGDIVVPSQPWTGASFNDQTRAKIAQLARQIVAAQQHGGGRPSRAPTPPGIVSDRDEAMENPKVPDRLDQTAS